MIPEERLRLCFCPDSTFRPCGKEANWRPHQTWAVILQQPTGQTGFCVAAFGTKAHVLTSDVLKLVYPLLIWRLMDARPSELQRSKSTSVERSHRIAAPDLI